MDRRNMLHDQETSKFNFSNPNNDQKRITYLIKINLNVMFYIIWS